MHCLESEVEKYRRRVQKIRANPDPAKLKANILLYELALKESEHRWKCYQEGRPFGFCVGGPRNVFRALGMKVFSSASRKLEETMEKPDRVIANDKRLGIIGVLAGLALLLSSCGQAAPAATPTAGAPSSPTATRAAATATPVTSAPTATRPTVAVPTATATATQPTSTPVPTPGPTFGRYNIDPDKVVGVRFAGVKPDFNAVPKRGGVLKASWNLVWPHFDVSQATGAGVAAPLAPAYSKLVSCKPGVEMAKYNPWLCEVGPDLAASWDISSDGKTYTFHLRQGVKFQNLPPVNGRELTAQDIKYSYELYKSGGAQSGAFATVQKIEAPDKYTVKVSLDGPDPDFLAGVACEIYSLILPREIADRDGDFKKTIGGTGPFQVKQVVGKERVVYERNPSYFIKDVPILDGYELSMLTDVTTVLSAFRAGLLHYPGGANLTVDAAKSLISSKPDTTAQLYDWDWAGYSIYMRLDKPPFNDVRVRRAMSMAIDRPGIVKDIFGGEGSIMAPAPWSYVFDSKPGLDKLPYYNYDPAKARQLLNDAGYADGFKFVANYYAYDAIRLQTPVIIDNLKAVGIKMDLLVQDNTAFNAALQRHAYDQAATGYVITRTSANGHYYQGMDSKSAGNWAGINDPELDKALEASAIEFDPAKRRALLQKAYQAEVENLYRVPMVYPTGVAIQSSKLHNFLYSIDFIPVYKLGRNFEMLWVDP